VTPPHLVVDAGGAGVLLEIALAADGGESGEDDS
jgi:DNA mismatch repair protein MutH